MASQEEMKEITSQFKNNADDLQAYLRDLENWQEEMNKKDDQLRSKSKAGAQNIDNKKECKESIKKVKVNPELMSESDYQAALKDVGLDVKDSEESNNDDKESLINSLQANIEKEHGNECYKKKNYSKAISYYTKGIMCDPNNAAIVANRAMSYLKLEKYVLAEEDCSSALQLDPTYVKAFQRRGIARANLQKNTEAINDFEEALRLDPNDKLSQKELDKLKSPKNSVKDKRSNVPSESITSRPLEIANKSCIRGEVSPIKKSLRERSKRPLQRISIIDA